MGRSHVTPIQQPNDTTCGPSALKIALSILHNRKSLNNLIERCKTNRNGTSTKNIVHAITELGYYVLVINYGTLTHITSSLKYTVNKPRAIMVSYLYDLDEKKQPHPDSGHWAVVSKFSASTNRIVLLDSATATRKSYNWHDFRERWYDFDFRRKKITERGKQFKLVRKWQPQLMLVIAKHEDELPKFTIPTAKVFAPRKTDEDTKE